MVCFDNIVSQLCKTFHNRFKNATYYYFREMFLECCISETFFFAKIQFYPHVLVKPRKLVTKTI